MARWVLTRVCLTRDDNDYDDDDDDKMQIIKMMIKIRDNFKFNKQQQKKVNNLFFKKKGKFNSIRFGSMNIGFIN